VPARIRFRPIATISKTCPRICTRQIEQSPTPGPMTCVHFLRTFPSAALRLRRWHGGCQRCGSFTVFSMQRDNAATTPPLGWGAQGPKRARPLPKVLSIGDVDTLLKQARANCENTDHALVQRLRAARLLCLLEVGYATGLRVSELVALPASAARLDQRILVV